MPKAPSLEKLGEKIEALENRVFELEASEKALQDKVARYRAMHAGFDGLIYICSPDFRITYVNKNFIERIGYDPTGEFCHKVLHDLDSECPWCRHEEVLNGQTVRHEVQSPKDDRWYYTISTPIHHPDGSRSRHAVLFDITDRKRTEQALKDAYLIINKSPAVGFLWKNSEGWPVEFVTDNVETLFGYSADAFMSGKVDYREVVYPEDLERVGQEVADHSADRACVSFKHKPYRIATEQGKIKWVEDNTFIRRNENGEITHYQGIVEDITGRKQIEEMLLLTKFCFDRASIGIWRTDRNARILDINDYACQYLGYTREELCRMSIPDINPNIDLKVWDHLWEAMQTKGSNTIETTHRSKNGTIIPVEVTANSIEFEGREFAVSFGKDISERKKAEEERLILEAQLLQAQKMEAVGTLAGGVAHDFNNLLQAISGFTQLLLMDVDKDSRGHDRLIEIEKATIKASDLIRQLLTFSRKVETRLVPTNLNLQLNQMKVLLERTIPKMIAIEYFLDENIPDIRADATQIEQIVLNLAINAKHAMPKGGKLILETKRVYLDKEYCKAHLGSKPGNYVLLMVTDTGTGMEQSVLDRIFEPFFTTKQFGEGTGLGLSVVFGIVKNHGGYITCNSNPGQGACFKIYFPGLTGKQDQEAPDITEIEASGGTETILVVDDDRSILQLSQELLEKYGYKTILAVSGETALEIYAEKKSIIDLVILDLNMPGMGGSECLTELYKLNHKIKVLVASGYSPDGNVRKTLEAAGGDFIGKPFRLNEMLRKIRMVLDESR